jgi:ribosomal protein S14
MPFKKGHKGFRSRESYRLAGIKIAQNPNSKKTQFKKGQKPWIAGKKHTEEAINKINKTWFKKGDRSWNKGLKGYRKGHFVSKETKIKIGEAQRGSKNHNWKGGKPKCIVCGKEFSQWVKSKVCRNCYKGENHWNWKGGITPEIYKIRGSLQYKLWQYSIFSKDKNICQKCGEDKISVLTAHHIQNFAQYPELRFTIDNGITFCRKCHKLFHKNYGRKNNNKKQIDEFIK